MGLGMEHGKGCLPAHQDEVEDMDYASEVRMR